MIHNLKVSEIDITNPRQRKRFITVPWKIYRGDRYWVPPLIGERMEFLDPGRNESFEHLDAAFFVAEGYVTSRQLATPQPGLPTEVGSEQTLGSVGAFINHRHNQVHDEQVGFFGFFEAVNDYEVVEALQPGQVVSYGEVAAEAGAPGAARAVGNLLRRSAGLPWWRVVAASGRLIPGAETEQRERLEAEGVVFTRSGRVARGE